MNADLFLALLLFAVVSSVTPGPNNLMLMTSGVNFGVRRSLPHLLGINVGFPLMIGLLGLGLGAIFLAYPAAHTGLRIVSMLYLLYLAWKIATAGPVQSGEEGSKPMSFLAAAMFHGSIRKPGSWPYRRSPLTP